MFNVLQGDKVAVDELLTNPTVKAISFVGSTPIAQYVYATARCTASGSRPSVAPRTTLVLPDADLDLAADAMINAGFGSAGERCMAICACVAVGPIADDLVAKIAERATGLKTGDGTPGLRHGTAGDQGPPRPGGLLRRRRRGRRRQPRRRRPRVSADGDADGFWLGPTLIDNVTPEMSVYTDEIFGPVLSVVRVRRYDDAVKLINANPYGNGTAIFTNDGGAARAFQNEVEVGMIGINVPIPVPTAYYSFGGWKSSLFGDTHAHGTEGVHFFTRGKVVTTRWLDPQPRRDQSRFPAERLTRHARTSADGRRGSQRAYELDRKHVFHSWSAQAQITPMTIAAADGSYVWDGDGNKLLDFSCQLVFTNIGHQHPKVVAAMPSRRPSCAPSRRSTSTPPAPKRPG